MKLSEIAAKLGLKFRGNGQTEITAPARIEDAGPGMLTFVAGPKYAAALKTTRASGAIVPPILADQAPCASIISDNPYFDFARALQLFFTPYRPHAGIDPTARIAPGAEIGEEAHVGAYCVIGSRAKIGRRAIIHSHVAIYPGVEIGDDFVCHSHVSIREGSRIGHRVTILNGAVIGADGFGFVERDGTLLKIPQTGNVIIEDDVEIGANTTIDRATIGSTIVRRAVKLDNLVHVGHNCDVGAFARLAAQVGLAGSVRVGEWCQFGGQSGCADHASIGARVRVVAQSGIPHDVGADSTVAGTPVMDIKLWRRWAALQPRLPEVMRRLRAIEEALNLSERRSAD